MMTTPASGDPTATSSGTSSHERAAATACGAHARNEPPPAEVIKGHRARRNVGKHDLVPSQLPSLIRASAYLLTGIGLVCLVLGIFLNTPWAGALAATVLVWMPTTGLLVGVTRLVQTHQFWASLGQGLWATLLLPRMVVRFLMTLIQFQFIP
jgi:hypothetical protein